MEKLSADQIKAIFEKMDLDSEAKRARFNELLKQGETDYGRELPIFIRVDHNTKVVGE